MELDEALTQRRSIRHFDPEHALDRETIAALLRSAAKAPSAGNRQPWRVAAVLPDAARVLCDALEPRAWELNFDTFRQVIARDPNVMGRAPSERELDDATRAWIDREIRLTGSFWLLVVHVPRRGGEGLVAEVDRQADLASVAAFMYGLTLAATERGLASCIQSTWCYVAPELHARLAIPDDHTIVGAVAVGRWGHVDPDYVARHFARRDVPVTWHA